MTDKTKAKGGGGRAEALSPSERGAIAKKAASARSDADIPQAEFEGAFPIGDAEVAAAVLLS